MNLTFYSLFVTFIHCARGPTPLIFFTLAADSDEKDLSTLGLNNKTCIYVDNIKAIAATLFDSFSLNSSSSQAFCFSLRLVNGKRNDLMS